MNSKEYLTLFSNTGNIDVSVRFKDHDGSVSNVSMEATELSKLVDPESGEFLKAMSFDEWPFEILKYEVDPVRNRLIITAKKAG